MTCVAVTVAALLTAILLPVPTRGQTAQSVSSDPAFRVTRYDLTAEIAPSERSLSSSALVTLEALSDDVRALRFYLHSEFSVRRVRAGGANLRFVRGAERDPAVLFSPEATPLDIDLERVLHRGGRLTLRIDYGGRISRTIAGINMISSELTELAAFAAWFPIQRRAQNFTYRLRLTLPASHRIAVTDGREASAATSGTVTTRVFERKTGGTDIPLVTGPGLRSRERREGATSARVVFQELDEATALASLEGSLNCIEAMTKLFGPSAAPAATVVFSPRGGGAYSRVPLIIGSEQGLRSAPKNRAVQARTFQLLAHEVAHFWWNLAATSTADDWLNESLAEYYSLRALERVEGAEDVVERWRQQFHRAMSVPADKSILSVRRNDPAAQALFYQRGSSIFRALEASLGRETLDRVLRRFYQRHRASRNATTAAFLETIREQFGNRFDAYLERMLTRGGLPEVHLAWDIRASSVSGSLTLEEPALVGFPVTLLFRDATGGLSARKRVTLQAGTTSWHFELPFAVVDVTVDPDAWLLRNDPAVLFRTRLTPLVHAANMNALPETLVPKANIESARAILDEWTRLNEGGPEMEFERAWLAFLDGRLEEAATRLERLLRLPDWINVGGNVAWTYSTLGRIYDLRGARDKALSCYREGRRISAEKQVDPVTMLASFQDFERTPYPRGRSIHLAAAAGHVGLLDELLRTTPTAINARDSELEMSPIFWALRAWPVNRGVVEWLVEHGADLDARDKDGRTVLDVVRTKRDTELANYLLSKGAK